MSERIYGIVPPMITPFRPDETLDEDAIVAETRYLIETARVHGLAVAGSTGEGHAMTTPEVRRVTELVVREARGRVGSSPALSPTARRRPSSAARRCGTWE
jgi:4-hydroxy-tetrahydrodipicolinate synthase